MTNDDDQPTTPPVPPVPPAPASPYTPVTPPPAADATPSYPAAAPAAPGFPTAPPTYTPTQPNGYAPGQPYAPGVAGPPRGLAIASMITGIAGLVLAFVGVGFLPAVAGVVLGHIAQRKQPYARPFWLTGLITGYVGVAIGLITAAFWIILIIASINTGSSYNDFS